MPDGTQRLGHCPECGEGISSAWALVEYERDDGSEGVCAKYPVCEDVVAPEQHGDSEFSAKDY